MTSSPDTHRTSLQRPQKFQKALYCPQAPPNLLPTSNFLKLTLGSSCGSSRISLEFSRVLKILKPSSPSHLSRKTSPQPSTISSQIGLLQYWPTDPLSPGDGFCVWTNSDKRITFHFFAKNMSSFCVQSQNLMSINHSEINHALRYLCAISWIWNELRLDRIQIYVPFQF